MKRTRLPTKKESLGKDLDIGKLLKRPWMFLWSRVIKLQKLISFGLTTKTAKSSSRTAHKYWSPKSTMWHMWINLRKENISSWVKFQSSRRRWGKELVSTRRSCRRSRNLPRLLMEGTHKTKKTSSHSPWWDLHLRSKSKDRGAGVT